jgi:hypothetical protein
LSKIGIVAVAALVALVLGFGARTATQTAEASATDIQLIGCELVAGGLDGNPDNTTTAAEVGDACGVGGGFLDPAEILLLDQAYGDDDGTIEPADLAARDELDANQLGEGCVAAGFQCTVLAFVYVDDEGPVTLDLPAGLASLQAGAIDFTCNTEGATLTADNDCLDPVANNGDGVVVFHIINATADDDDVLTVNATQEGDTVSGDLTIVGAADEVTLTLLKTTLQESTSAADLTACRTQTDVTDSDVLTAADATIAVATVTDNDGDELARVTVDIESADADIAEIAVGTQGAAGTGVTGNTGQTVVSEAAGTAQFAVVCADNTGDVDITATINEGQPGEEASTVALSVVGAPDAIALTASPATIACDGTATSTVTATVTDSAGNNVADDTNVNFSVVALGTANPINADTVDGVASSVITPLSNASAGVTVIVSAGDAQSSIRVDCSIPIPTQPTTGPGPVATPTRSGIGGPDTGNGGYVGQDGSGFPTWMLIALALGSVALVAGGLVTRRVGK